MAIALELLPEFQAEAAKRRSPGTNQHTRSTTPVGETESRKGEAVEQAEARKRQGARTDLNIPASVQGSCGEAAVHVPELQAEARKRQATSTGGANPQLTASMQEAAKHGEAAVHAAELNPRILRKTH